MKKLIASLVLVVLAGCHSAPKPSAPSPVVAGNQTGAADPQGAIRGFMEAVKQQDIQTMGALWGTAEGAARDQMDRTYREKAELIMMCYLKHDRFDILGDAPNPGGSLAFAVSVTYQDLTRATTFQVIQGPGRRWYVENVDIPKLSDICARKG